MPLPLFRKSLQLQGYDLRVAQKVYELAHKATTVDLEEQRMAVAHYHWSNNAFYKSLVGNKPTQWYHLPVLTKRDLQHPLQERLSAGYSLNKLHLGSTSGSSGHPFTYAKDKACHAIAWAAFDNAYARHGIDLDSLEARFYGIPASGSSRWKEQLKDFVGNRKRFPVFNLNDDVLHKYVKMFKKHPFKYINGYTSSITLFAKYCQQQEIVLKDICPSLKACVVTSEMLFDDDRELLEKALGVPIINEYGSSETGLIAMQDQEGDLALNTGQLFVEVVDQNNHPVADGTVGKILITDLFNKAHPFIRYEIGDLGSISTVNNKRVLQHLQGRTSDIAYLPNGKVIPGLTFYYVTKTGIQQTNKVQEFVIIQKEPLLFHIAYVATSSLDHEEKKSIEKSMATYADAAIKVSFEQQDYLDRSRRGKLQQFISEVKT